MFQCFVWACTDGIAVVRRKEVRPGMTVVTPGVPTVYVPAGMTRFATVNPNIVSTVIVEFMGSLVRDRLYEFAAYSYVDNVTTCPPPGLGTPA